LKEFRALKWYAPIVLATMLAAFAPVCHAAASDVKVIVLGTYHFSNSNLDLINTKVDDVLLPQRQKELETLSRQLSRFAPTRVMVERNADKHEGHSLPAYAEWRSGGLRSVRNEVEQIGFRLAADLDHDAVYGIDTPGSFPFDRVMAWAKEHGAEAQLNAQMADVAKQVRSEAKRLESATISASLASINAPAKIFAGHQFYTQTLQYGRGAEQPGAELVGQWYLRNARICARMIQLAKSGDRIVVVYGAGHSYLLRQCVSEQRDWTLVEANDYLLKE